MALVKLHSSVVAQCSSSKTWKILFQCISIWCNGQPPLTVQQVATYNCQPILHNLLIQAIKEQDSIRWDLSVRGYLSRTWVDAQTTEQRAPSTPQRVWLKWVILALLHFQDSMWKYRNHTLHEPSDSSLTIKQVVPGYPESCGM